MGWVSKLLFGCDSESGWQGLTMAFADDKYVVLMDEDEEQE